MALFDVLGQRWTMRILWEISQDRLTFRELRARCDDVSPTLLNKRLKQLREVCLVDHDTQGYGLSVLGMELKDYLLELSAWSHRWADMIDKS